MAEIRMVYTKSLAIHLIGLGFEPVSVTQVSDSFRKVWNFRRSAEFDKAFDEYVKQRPSDKRMCTDYYRGGLSKEDIASKYNVLIERVESALEKDPGHERLTAMALLSPADRESVGKLTPEERDRVYMRVLRLKPHTIHANGKDIAYN